MKKVLNEDWLAFIVGFFLIGVSIFIIELTLPKFNWAGPKDLKQLFNASNVAAIGWLYLLMAATGLSSLVIGNKKVGRLLTGLTFIFVIGILAQLLAGYRLIKGFGLEYVVV